MSLSSPDSIEGFSVRVLTAVALLTALSLAIASCGGRSEPESTAVTREEAASTMSEPRAAVTEVSAPEPEWTADPSREPTSTDPTPVSPILIATDPATLDPERQTDVVGDTDMLREAQAELGRHRALWEANRAEDYSFVLAPMCFCPQHLLDPVTVRVADGVVASVTYVESGEAPEHAGFGRYLTIDELFDVIQEAIGGKASQITVTYDSAIGYPTNARLDYDARMADEEYIFTASDYLKR